MYQVMKIDIVFPELFPRKYYIKNKHKLSKLCTHAKVLGFFIHL